MGQKEFVREMFDIYLNKIKKEFNDYYFPLIELLTQKERDQYEDKIIGFVELTHCISTKINNNPKTRVERAIQSAWFEFSYTVWSTINSAPGLNRIFDLDKYYQENPTIKIYDAAEPDPKTYVIPAHIILNVVFEQVLMAMRED